MAAPTYFGGGIGSNVDDFGGGGKILPTYPVGAPAGALYCLATSRHGNTTDTPTWPAGWVAVSSLTAIVSEDGVSRHWLHTRVGTGAQTNTFTIVMGAAPGRGSAVCWALTGDSSNWHLEDVGYHVTSGQKVTYDEQVTTAGPNRMAMNILYFEGRDRAGGLNFIGETGGSWTAGAANTTTDGNGWVAMAYATMPSAGTIGGGSFTLTATAPYIMAGLAAYADTPASPKTINATGTAKIFNLTRSPPVAVASGLGSSSTPSPLGKRSGLILNSLTGKSPTPQFIADNISWIDSLPFDGIVVNVRHPIGSEPGAPPSPIDVSNDIWTSPIASSDMLSVMSPLSGVPFSNLKRRFALVNVRDGLDFFDDWTDLSIRLRVLSGILMAAGFTGIYLDNNPREGWNSYASAVHSDTKSLEEYQARAYGQGMLLMEAITLGFPNIRIIHALGPYVSFLGSGIYSDSLSGSDNLQGPFFVGFLVGRDVGNVIDGASGLTWARNYDNFNSSYQWRNVTVALDATIGNDFIPYTHRGKLWEANIDLASSIRDEPYTDPLAGAVTMDPLIMRRTIPIAMRHCDHHCMFHATGRSYIDQTSASQQWIDAVSAGRDSYSSRTILYSRVSTLAPRWEEQSLGIGAQTPPLVVGYTLPMIELSSSFGFGSTAVAVAPGVGKSSGFGSVACVTPAGATAAMTHLNIPVLSPSGHRQGAGVPFNISVV